MTVGILALQGDFQAHARRLADIGATSKLIKSELDLPQISALIIPGGESSTLLRLMTPELQRALKDSIASGLPTLATCAGLILIAKRVMNPEQESFGVLDIDVVRNGFGRQVDSFISPSLELTNAGRRVLHLDLPGSVPNLEGVFIRAPRICRVGAGVEVLATVPSAGATDPAEPVLVKQGQIFGMTFHPELSTVTSLTGVVLHKLLLDNRIAA